MEDRFDLLNHHVNYFLVRDDGGPTMPLMIQPEIRIACRCASAAIHYLSRKQLAASVWDQLFWPVLTGVEVEDQLKGAWSLIILSLQSLPFGSVLGFQAFLIFHNSISSWGGSV